HPGPRSGHPGDLPGRMVLVAAGGFQEPRPGNGVAGRVLGEHSLLAGFRLLLGGRGREAPPPHPVPGPGGTVLSLLPLTLLGDVSLSAAAPTGRGPLSPRRRAKRQLRPERLRCPSLTVGYLLPSSNSRLGIVVGSGCSLSARTGTASGPP